MVSADTIAEILLHLGGWAFLAKTVAFLILAIVLFMQRPLTAVGKWLIALFVTLVLSSFNVTNLTFYLDTIADAGDVHSFRTWSLVVGDVLFPLAVAVCGIGVLVSQRRVERQYGGDDP